MHSGIRIGVLELKPKFNALPLEPCDAGEMLATGLLFYLIQRSILFSPSFVAPAVVDVVVVVVVEVVGHASGGRSVAVAGFCLPFQMNTKVATIHFAIKKGLGKILTFEEAGQ